MAIQLVLDQIKSWRNFLTDFKLLRLSKPAEKDLRLIAAYTNREWGEVQKNKYLGIIQQSLKSLADLSVTGKLRNDIATDLYCYSIQKHLIFYRETEQELLVLRVLHERMGLNQHLLR